MKIFSSQKKYNLPIYDYRLIWTSLLLLGIGLVMVYSSSVDVAAASKSSSYQNHYYLLRQSIYIGLGLFIGYISFQIPIYFWQRMAPYLFIIGLISVPSLSKNKAFNTYFFGNKVVSTMEHIV